MSPHARTVPVHPVTWLLALLAIALVLLPLWGLWLTHQSPSSPWSPPPQDWTDMGPLMGRSLALAIEPAAPRAQRRHRDVPKFLSIHEKAALAPRSRSKTSG